MKTVANETRCKDCRTELRPHGESMTVAADRLENLQRVAEAAKLMRSKHKSRGDWVAAKAALDAALRALESTDG